MRNGDYRSLSFWHDTLPGALEARAPLSADHEVDVGIVGAGDTGLWSRTTAAPGALLRTRAEAIGSPVRRTEVP